MRVENHCSWRRPARKGRNLGTKSSARGVATHSLQGGPALSSPAFLAPVFAGGGTGVSENWSAPSENKRTEPLPFCLLVPTDLCSVFLLAKYLLWLFRLQSHHTRARRTSPDTEKGPFVPGPGLPGTLLSPGIGRAPRRRVVFSHAVLQWAFFHSTIDGPTAFISRN